MEVWPLELIVVSFATGHISTGLLDQLRASRTAGVIHIVDGGIVRKGTNGELSLRPAHEIEFDRGPYTGKLMGLLFGDETAGEWRRWQEQLAHVATRGPQRFGLSADDLAEIVDAIPRASEALALVVEHRWTAGFVESVAVDQGVILAEGVIVPQTLTDLIGRSEENRSSP